VVALAWLWSALAAIANFAFRYPAFDQFRLYPIYLGLPFPDNVIQLENGHRPVLPALVRVAEILWFKADQNLQIVVGAGSALAAALFLMTTIARERAMPAVTRAAACLLVVIAVFWLGNARMLMHGNELVHAYFVVLFAVLAFLCVSKARQGNERSWAAAAAVCCCAATFSFGTGAATFLAVLVLAVMTRLRLASLAIVLTAFAASMAIHLAGLPGDKGVRNSLLLDPAGNLSVLARWLAAPWMRAWLGHGEPPIEPWLQNSMSAASLGKVLVVTANWISAPLGTDAAARIAAVVGICGVVAYAAALIHAWRRPESLTTTRVVALGLSTFGVGAAVIVCLARLHLFEHSPDQVFADRYLPWSCLFWLGLGLYPVAGNGTATLARTAGLPCAAVVIAAIFLPSHRSLAGWSATVSRHIQQSAVAAQLGIWDPARFEDVAAPSDDVVKSLALLKQRRLSMFAEQGFSFVSGPWRAPAPGPALDAAYAHVSREFEDPHSHRRIADFEGLDAPNAWAAG